MPPKASLGAVPEGASAASFERELATNLFVQRRQRLVQQQHIGLQPVGQRRQER
jgi:hypothetical protein